MKPSECIKTFIKGYEKCRLRAFMPTPNDRPTIGWGRTAGVVLGMTQSQAEADTDFAKDIELRGARLTAALGNAPTTQGQFDAILSLAYNAGVTAITGSHLFAAHKAGRFADAARMFGDWNKQSGIALGGLTKRRAAERKIYEGACK